VAFTELVRRYHGPLLRVALAFVRERGVAEEVVQDTWLGVLDGLSRFDGRASLRTWIFRILTNRAKTRRERESRSVPFSALGDEGDESDAGVDPARFDTRAMWQDPPHPWDAHTAEELLRYAEARRVMEATMSTLSEAQRAVITLRDLEGVGAEETCVLLEITMSNQRVLLHRARTRVRGALERHFRGGRSC
jgi:RNA polymerase sigma-70 factor (ECF subfamily)